LVATERAGRRRGRWLRFGAFCAVLSAAAIAARLLGYPPPLSGPVARLLDGFLEPGLTIWWMSTGSLFAGFPATRGGQMLTVAGNVAFWLAMAHLATRLWRAVAAQKAED